MNNIVEIVKVYNGIPVSEHKYDEVISLIAADVETKIFSLNCSKACKITMCVEDFARYLKHGCGAYEVAQPTEDISGYSKSTQELIKSTMKIRVFSDPAFKPAAKVTPKPLVNPLDTITETTLPGLFTIDYDVIEPSMAAAVTYFRNKNPRDMGCSGVFTNDFQLRNFDWAYLNTAALVLHTAATTTRLESWSVVDGFPELSPKYVKAKIPSEIYKHLPWMVLEGINSAHIAVQINQLDNIDTQPVTGTAPGRPEILSGMLCRYILDNVSDLSELEQKLSMVNIKDSTHGVTASNYQFLVTSPAGARIVTFNGNDLVVLNPSIPILTNFKLYWNTITSSGINTGILTPHSVGVERWNILNAGKSAVTNVATGLQLLKSVRYSQKYTNPDSFLSEYATYYKARVYDWRWDNPGTDPECSVIKDTARNLWEDRDNTGYGEVWWTSHSSVIDIYNNSITIALHEDYDKTYTVKVGVV